MLEAIRRFDPDKGVRLVSYAGFWMRAFILRFLMENKRLVRPARTRASRAAFFRGEALPGELSLVRSPIPTAMQDPSQTGWRIPGAPADVVLEGRILPGPPGTASPRSLAGSTGEEEAILRQRLLADEPEARAAFQALLGVARAHTSDPEGSARTCARRPCRLLRSLRRRSYEAWERGGVAPSGAPASASSSSCSLYWILRTLMPRISAAFESSRRSASSVSRIA